MAMERPDVPFAKGATKRDPFSIRLSDDKQRDFTQWLTQEIIAGCDARSRYMADGGLYDTWHAMYDQAERPRDPAYPDSADLASWLPTEKTDALKARLVQILFGSDPICTVEGWGEKPERAALVEAFHQWKADDERLRSWVDKAVLNALIEQNGILEVGERKAIRKFRGTGKFMPVMDQGVMQFGANGTPTPAFDAFNKLVPWNGEDTQPALELSYEEQAAVCNGPQYRILSGKDFLYLPAHARDMSEVWGFAKRIFKRLPELQYAAKAGLYDKDAVDQLGTHGERDATMQEIRNAISIAPQDGPTAEKELWEVQLIHDIDDDGIEEWLMTTVSVTHDQLLRLQFDDLHQTRYLSFTPFPDPLSIWGKSFVGHKLWTTSEEHTAYRNMAADGTAMAVSAPVMRLSTALWHPDRQPWGARATIDVRDFKEIQQAQVKDVPQSVFVHLSRVEQAAERLSGLNDSSIIGATSVGDKPTATEVQTTAHASFVRVEDPLHYLQETLQDLYQLRHRIWVKTLEADPKGLVVPQQHLIGLETRGLTIPKDGPFAVTAALLDGDWKFTPKGSTETSDISRQRQDFGVFIAQALPMMFKMFPPLAQQFVSNPKIGELLLQHALRLYRMNDIAPLLSQQGAPGLPAGPMGADPIAGLLSQLMSGQNGAGATPAAPPAGLPPPVPVPPPALTQ